MEKARSSEISQKVTLKSLEKKKLLCDFLNDERVQVLLSAVLVKHAGIKMPGCKKIIPVASQNQAEQVIPAEIQPELRVSPGQVNLATDL